MQKNFQSSNKVKDVETDKMESYTKPLKELLNYYECLQLLDTLLKHKIVYLDTKNNENVMVYRKASKSYAEGWYSVNKHMLACELLQDIKWQIKLRKDLKKQSIKLEFTSTYKVR